MFTMPPYECPPPGILPPVKLPRWKIFPQKIAPRKLHPLGKLSPPPISALREIASDEIFWELFTISYFYFYGDFRL